MPSRAGMRPWHRPPPAGTPTSQSDAAIRAARALERDARRRAGDEHVRQLVRIARDAIEESDESPVLDLAERAEDARVEAYTGTLELIAAGNVTSPAKAAAIVLNADEADLERVLTCPRCGGPTRTARAELFCADKHPREKMVPETAQTYTKGDD